MRNVLLYIDNIEILDFAIDRARKENLDITELTVVLQLSELSKEVIPLIGDLAELRALKYLKLLDEWYQNQPVKSQYFNPVVLQSDFKTDEIERLLYKGGVTEIYLFDLQSSKMNSMLKKLSNAHDISIIEVDSASGLEACE